MKPTRRAARLAAQKIFNTVHMYGLDEPAKPEKEYFPPGGHFSSSEHTGLLMECCEEILSGVQREAFYKAKQAYEEANQKIIYLKSINAKIINNLDSDFQIDSESNENNHGMDSKVGPKFLESNSSIAIHPVINIKPVQQQTITITTGTDNSSLSDALPNANPSSYKVYDSRTGAVVGTLPGDTTIVSQDGVHISSALEPITILKVDKEKQFTIKSSLLQEEKSKNNNSSESKYTLQKTLTIVSGGHKMVTTFNLLSVRVKANLTTERIFNIRELKNSLNREKYREDAVQWMIKKKLLPNQTKCKWCSLSSLNLIVDKSLVDGYTWKCSNLKCKKTCPVNRLPFFGRFGISMSRLLALTYHWVAQTDTADVMMDVGVDVYTVRSVWRTLQEVCGIAVALKSSKLGGSNCSVEFGIAQLGRFLIIGVYDRRTGLTRVKAMSVAVGLNVSVFLKTIQPWLHKKSLVISNDAKLSKLSTIGLQHVLVKSSSPEAAVHTDNITNYLRKQLSFLFGEFAVNQLKIDTIQGFLDELQWRERFDTSPKECFWNILKHITDQSGKQGSTCETNQIVPSAITVSDIGHETLLKRILKEGNSSSNKKQKVNGVDVILDEYYYARLEPQITIIEKNKDKANRFKCQLCKKYIDNNIKVMKHMNGHIEKSRQKNLDLLDLTQCKYCFKEFQTPYSMQCHIEAVHLQTNSLACRICNQGFPDVTSLVYHMKMIHCQTEMPYSCSVCHYRSSFHSDVIEHFQQYHNGSNEIMCHYCLKVFVIKFSSRGLGFVLKFYDHLHKHQCKSSSKKCSSCCLTFLNIQDLRNHKTRDHQSMASVKGVVPIKSLSTKPIIVTNPHIKPNNSDNYEVIIIDDKDINKSKFSKKCSVLEERDVSLSIAKEVIGYSCFECKNSIEQDHFKKFSVCKICHYSTNCNKAFLNHMVHHENNSGKLQTKSSIQFNHPMFCVCGFSHSNADILASHLSYCKKTSCYSSKQDALAAAVKSEPEGEYFDCPSAFFPPLVVLDDDDEEESINESFAKLSAPNILLEEEKILPIDETILEDQISKGVVPIKSLSTKPIIVTNPHIKPNNSDNYEVIIIDDKDINKSKFSKKCSVLEERDVSLSIAKEVIGYSCFECKNSIEQDHFKKFSVCKICHYSTNCNKAFLNHMVHHENNSGKLQTKSSIQFNHPMFCVCGFSHSNADILASHLSYCKKTSCYSSKQDALAAAVKSEPEGEYFDCPSAFFPPLVVLDDDDEEESINESFAKLSAPNILLEEEKILPIDETILEDQISKDEKDERPNMLNALGLVRKKSSSLPPGTSVFHDESSQDVILPSSGDLSQSVSPTEKTDSKVHPVELSKQNEDQCDAKTITEVNLNDSKNDKSQLQTQPTENIIIAS
ncbi:uncharacterized protein LOC111626616 isoform X2 [Centruroides sculpturatus]|nr:uncharacterized protein LOC111626616 isoform X2 [Centruroides sculpturatus]XP_023225832.1 uncharacterized protein LOC111626616 isoform X2 [Centruroides sculpturatus]